MAVKDRVLIVEDDTKISNLLTMVLGANEYECICAGSASQALSMVASHRPDLMLLDLGLPDRDGLELIRELRQYTRMPILVVSARTQEQDKVAALDLGADDYIAKPFGNSELLARMRTALRHSLNTGLDPNIALAGMFRTGELAIDYGKRKVYIRSEDARLTQNEYRLVALLGRYAGRVLTYDFIIKELWGKGMQGGNQILRVNMANIRRKIEDKPAEPRYIFTEVGVGYRMAEPDED